MVTIRDPQDIPKRLVKVWLPVELVRRMDAAILRSGEAYFDRAEYIAEAVEDRLAEEEYAPRPEPRRVRPALAPVPEVAEFAPDIPVAVSRFGEWLSGKDMPSAPVVPGPEANFGLHNRDFPTIWACDFLGRRTAEAGERVAWKTFSAELIRRAWAVGRRLAADDAEMGRTVKASIGFPTNAAKREAAERRFLAHAFGLPGARGNPGPVFVFRMVGFERAGDGIRVALTDAGLSLVRALAETGDLGPPFGETAWRAFANHLFVHARPELGAWFKVLALLRDRPNRTELVERCTWWSGNEAATNAMSYVSRGREWGLVEPRLDRESRYLLTDRGAEELDRLTPILEGKAS